MRNLSFFSFVLLCLLACSSEPEWQPLSLLEYGMPVTILAPDSVDIKKMDLVLQEDVSVKKGDDYYVQIFSAEATTRDPEKLKESLKEEVMNNPFFSALVEEGTEGFIYKDQIDSLHSTYGFRYVRIIGDKEYVFQTGLTGSFRKNRSARCTKQYITRKSEGSDAL